MRLTDCVFTSESVSEGHPDKVCDRISDEIVDLLFREAIRNNVDPSIVRAACETLATTDRVVIAGEYRCPGDPDVIKEKIVGITRDAIRAIGYEQEGFHWNTCQIDVLLHEQSLDIAQGVDGSLGGAGDQGLMFGYACRDTAELTPAPISYAHRILEKLSMYRAQNVRDCGVFGPDAKTQVTVRYRDGKPCAIEQIVLSIQHLDPSMTPVDVRYVAEPVIREVLEGIPIDPHCKWWINSTGRFVMGGPHGDCGLTGRKIVVDTYGGMAPHGGGAFSGKDPTKVDRSAAYAARYLAKNVVAAGLADRCTIQLAYAIGVTDPLALYVDLHGTGTVSETRLSELLLDLMDLSQSGIRAHFDLARPIYAPTSAYGHFGRSPESGFFSWEKTDLVASLLDRTLAREIVRRPLAVS